MRPTLALVVVILAGGLALAAAPKQAPGEFEHSDRFIGQTDDRQVELRVGKGARVLRVLLVVKAREGALHWTLRDPHGQVRGEGDVAQGEGYFEAEHQQPIRGRWVLELSRRCASGSYRLSWNVE